MNAETDLALRNRMSARNTFVDACEKGHTERVRHLLFPSDPWQSVDPAVDDNCAIRHASANGCLETVRLLLTHAHVDPTAAHNEAIRRASSNGHHQTVRLLLNDDRVDPSALNNYAIRGASSYGHVEVVRLLLSDARVDPSAINNYAFVIACHEGYREIACLLLEDRRIDPTVTLRRSWSFNRVWTIRRILSHPRALGCADAELVSTHLDFLPPALVVAVRPAEDVAVVMAQERIKAVSLSTRIPRDVLFIIVSY